MTATRSTRVAGVADAYLRARAELDPEAAAALGRAPTVRLPRLAPGDFSERAALDRRTVAALDAAPDDDHLLAAAMRERLSSDIALDEVGFTRRLLAPLATPVHLVRQVFDGLPLADADDGEVLLANLEPVPQTLADYLATLTESARSDRPQRRGRSSPWPTSATPGCATGSTRVSPRASRRACGSWGSTAPLTVPHSRRPTSPTRFAARCCPARRAPTPWDATSTRPPAARSSAPRSIWTSCTRGAGELRATCRHRPARWPPRSSVSPMSRLPSPHSTRTRRGACRSASRCGRGSRAGSTPSPTRWTGGGSTSPPRRVPWRPGCPPRPRASCTTRRRTPASRGPDGSGGPSRSGRSPSRRGVR